MKPGIKDTQATESFWSARYQEQSTGWDIGYPSTPIKEYIDQLENKEIRILIPGAGNAYEAEYLFKQGFKKVYVMDIAAEPLREFQVRNPDFPANQLLQENFFEHQGQYDLIFEQTFFCSFPPNSENREAYTKKVHSLLQESGKLVGLWFTFPLKENQSRPPYGGSKSEYLEYMNPYFEVITFEEAYNSIKPRLGNELFGIFLKKII